MIEQTLVHSIKSRGSGMTDTVRHLWVLSLSHSAAVHDAMSSLSGVTKDDIVILAMPANMLSG